MSFSFPEAMAASCSPATDSSRTARNTASPTLLPTISWPWLRRMIALFAPSAAAIVSPSPLPSAAPSYSSR
jgi:hypothetical protein